MLKSIQNKKNLFWEIVRFVVVGVIATLFDFGTKTLISYFFPKFDPSLDWLRFGIIILCGFIVGVIVNYILSVIWVFQDVDTKNNVKSQSNFWLFILLGFIGFLLGLAIFYFFQWVILLATQNAVNIDIDKEHINFESVDFWAYFGVFCFQTLVVLVYNYISRKKFIFKPQKTEEPKTKD